MSKNAYCEAEYKVSVDCMVSVFLVIYLSIYLSIYLFFVKKFHNQTLLNLVKRLGGTLIMNRLYKLLLSLILSPIFYFVFLKIYILLFCV